MRRHSYIICFLLVVSAGFAQSHEFRIATFNIQNFGQKKMDKTAITDTLASIVRAFDIVAVQEISDVSNQTPVEFLRKVNQPNPAYALSCSPRSGQQVDDVKSAEQYAFFYNKNTVQLLDSDLFDDSPHDLFQREPWIAKFKRKSDGLTFTLCTVHTTPALAVEEIAALSQVARWIPQRFDVHKSMIFCGDFNASCSYASEEELEKLEIHRPPYYWIIPDDAKTNLSKKDCAYDRFVVTETLRTKITDWKVYRAFKSKAVSDHWPVYLVIK